jgi:hypothetical protein
MLNSSALPIKKYFFSYETSTKKSRHPVTHCSAFVSILLMQRHIERDDYDRLML